MSEKLSTPRRAAKKGSGLISAILSVGDKVFNNLLPIQRHISSYNYCDPGTKLVHDWLQVTSE